MIKSLYVLELGIASWEVKIKMFYIDNLLRKKKQFHLLENICKISFLVKYWTFHFTGKIARPLFCMVNYFVCLFVCLGLTSLWNIWGHITTVPACSSGTLTNVLPHRNAMPQTQDTTPHPVTVYRHGANLSLCYPSMWNVTLEYTATHFNVLGETRPGNPSPTFHTHQRTFNLMLSWWSTVGSSIIILDETNLMALKIVKNSVTI